MIFSLLCILSLLSFSVRPGIARRWPDGPLTTDGRWIKNALGEKVTMVGTNWPGHLEIMIPEGLQYASADFIAGRIKSLGMNSVRLTFAIQMVDEIFEKGHDTSIRDSLFAVLGETNGTVILNQILAHNPSFTPSTTRLEVFGAVAKALEKKEIYLHLDNHVSLAKWCCGDTDGNSWFGDTYFDATKWRRGLAYMAGQAKHWPNLLTLGLRNELRRSKVTDLPYDFADWYKNMVAAADEIHASNPDILMFFGGLNYTETLAPIPLGLPLISSTGGESFVFNPADFAWHNKIVLEVHIYTMSDRISTSDCGLMSRALYDNGFNAQDEQNPHVLHHFPVVMSEWGIAQDSSSLDLVYTKCLQSFLTRQRSGWMNWALAGSYMVRSGGFDVDDTWGMFNHNWTDWRSYEFINEFIKPFVKQTLSSGQDCT